jgi:tetratricopeptide (TPR) repeat protein
MAKAAESDKKELSMEELLTGIGKLIYKLNESVEDGNAHLEKLESNLLAVLQEGFNGIAGKLEKSNELLGVNSSDPVDKKVFVKELGKVTKLLSESAKSIEKAVKDVMSKQDKKGGDTLVEQVNSIDKAVKENSQYQKEQLEEMSKLLSLHSLEAKDNRVKELNRSAIMYFNNAEYEQALSSLQDAIEISPDSPGLLANMAHVKASQGKLDEAEEDYRKALKSDPNLEPAISGLGTILVHTGRANETIEFLQKFFERESEPSIGVMIAMSRAYAAEENHSKAVALLEQAEKIAPGHPELEQELAKYR